MAGGNLFGAVFCTFAFAAIWVFVSPAIDQLCVTFAYVITVLPTLQDAVNGFNIAVLIYGILPAIVFITIWVNYFMNEQSESSQAV